MKPPRLSSLRIERFRQIKQLTIPEIGHVNLVVGENNSGKSTLLDALQFFAAGADPEVLTAILSEHGESEYDSSERSISGYSLRNLFSNREFPSKDQELIYVGDQSGHHYVTLEHIFLKEEFVENPDDDDLGGRSRHVTRHLKNSGSPSLSSTSHAYFDAVEIISEVSPKHENRIEFHNRFRKSLKEFFNDPKDDFPISVHELLAGQSYSYVPPRLCSANELAEIWDGIVLTPYEELVLTALRVIDPDVVSLAFVVKGRQRRRLDLHHYQAKERIAVLKINNKEKPIPLLSMGDGMSRVLQLILFASQAKDGFLLVDEIENGLHYSVQEKVWGMLFELAEKNNIQIFATTHSEDCVKTFAKVSTERQNVKGCLICLGRSPEGETEAAVLNEDQVQTLVQADIELR
jgi:predicted ATP-dependent endonuclease of OLD family